jgi:hypothetical protein
MGRAPGALRMAGRTGAWASASAPNPTRHGPRRRPIHDCRRANAPGAWAPCMNARPPAWPPRHPHSHGRASSRPSTSGRRGLDDVPRGAWASVPNPTRHGPRRRAIHDFRRANAPGAWAPCMKARPPAWPPRHPHSHGRASSRPSTSGRRGLDDVSRVHGIVARIRQSTPRDQGHPQRVQVRAGRRFSGCMASLRESASAPRATKAAPSACRRGLDDDSRGAWHRCANPPIRAAPPKAEATPIAYWCLGSRHERRHIPRRTPHTPPRLPPPRGTATAGRLTVHRVDARTPGHHPEPRAILSVIAGPKPPGA